MMKYSMLGVTKSAAAYKSVDAARRQVPTGQDHVILIGNSTKFISPHALGSIIRNKVYVDTFNDEDRLKVTHIKILTEFDLSNKYSRAKASTLKRNRRGPLKSYFDRSSSELLISNDCTNFYRPYI